MRISKNGKSVLERCINMFLGMIYICAASALRYLKSFSFGIFGHTGRLGLALRHSFRLKIRKRT